MNSKIIKYALDQNTFKPVFIENASNGLSCECICFECGLKLQAIQSQERKIEWHFRHDVKCDCSGGLETAIHKLAKQIIVENSQIQIPGEILFYGLARQEEPFQSIIPDVTVLANELPVYFEITVTHGVENSKEKLYKNGEHKSIEIDLTNVSYDTSPEELKNIVLNQLDNKRIIFWSKETANEKGNSDNFIVFILLGIAAFFFGRFLFKGSRKIRSSNNRARYWNF